MDGSQRFLLGITLVLFLVFSQYHVFGVDREAWFDVSFSLETAHLLNEGQDIDFQEYDVHSPLYYSVLAVWQRLNPGMTEYHWGQQLSILFGLLFLLFAFASLTAVFGTRGSWTALILSVIPTYIHYGTEVRSYILVIAMSSVVIWTIIRGFKGVERVLGIVMVVLLPVVQYIAAIALPFYFVLHLVMNMSDEKKDALKGAVWLVVSGVVGVCIALYWAIPQNMRGEGMWFVMTDLWSFPAALAYSFVAIQNNTDFTMWSSVFYFAFTFIVIGVAMFGLRALYTRNMFSKADKMRLMMGFTAILPLILLVLIEIVPVQYSNIYHHRFFLLVTWLFTALIILAFFDFLAWIRSKKSFAFRGYLLVFFGIIGILLLVAMHSVYMDTVHYELQNLMYGTPCEEAYIGHESAFSYLPYEVKARERGCAWNNFVSVNITPSMATTAGYDAIPDENIYWNATIPKYGFYYVQSNNEVFDIKDREVVIILEEDGVRLLKVGSVVDVDVAFS